MIHTTMTEQHQRQQMTDDPATLRFEEEPAPHIDPYWNFIPRTALMYSIPVLLFSLCLYKGWIGMSREFWVPLAFAFLILAPGTRLRTGRPFAYKDFQYRDRFLATYALLPASLWCILINLLPSPLLAVPALVLILVAYDAVLIHYDFLCVYALAPHMHEGTGASVLWRFSLPLWGYLSLALLAVHWFGADTLATMGFASVLVALPIVALWFYWRKRWAPPMRFAGIHNVAVIGGGWSGIYAVRWLHEAGMRVTCFEATDSVGGVWKYRRDRPGGVFETTRVTASKHFLHPSDFPLPPTTLEFPYHPEVLEHLQHYVDHFNIRDCFHLDTQVMAVERAGEGWRVITRAPDGMRHEEVFDAVVVSSGPHQHPNIKISEHPLYSRFTGRIIHSAEYKTSADVSRGENILVVGVGESSADIVAECVHQGASVHWSARGGQWFADRNMGPYPADHITTQGMRVFAGLFGFWEYLVRRFVTGAFVNLAWGRGGHGIPEWTPEAPYLHQFLNKSRDGLLEIYSGRVVPHRAPVRIVGNEVYFAGDVHPVCVDTIILATGYKPVWPFLRDQVKALYKHVFHPDTPTLAFVGFARPIVGSIPSLSELQARWLAQVWSGAVTFPCPSRLRTEMHFDAKHHRRVIRDTSALGSLVEQELYATQIASLFNAHVHWLKLLVTWPRAFFALLISPWAPFKYWLNDADPERRRQALAYTLQELPTPRAPSYLLAIGIVVTALIFLSVLVPIFWNLPLPQALAATAILGFVVTCGNRLTERERKLQRALADPVREVFPF